jgi:SAM-dependent methyltransferase
MHIENKLTHNWLAKKIQNDGFIILATKLTGTVIDLGCGTRPYEKEILQHAVIYYGIDWPNTLHDFQANIGADLSKELPIASNCIDGAICLEVLEHLPEPSLLINEVFRILKTNGKFIISTPFQWREHEQPWDYYRYTRYGLEYLLKKAGFKNITIIAKSGFWVMWILKLNYHLTLLIRGPKIVRRAIRLCLLPIWWSGQYLAPLLDYFFGGKDESIGYFAIAEKI